MPILFARQPKVRYLAYLVVAFVSASLICGFYQNTFHFQATVLDGESLAYLGIITSLCSLVVYAVFRSKMSKIPRQLSELVRRHSGFDEQQIPFFKPDSQLVPSIAFHIAKLMRENQRLSLELEKRDSEYRSILDTQSEIVFLVGDDGFITYKNRAFDLFFENPIVKVVDNNLDGFSRKVSHLMSDLNDTLDQAKKTRQKQHCTTSIYQSEYKRIISWTVKLLEDSYTPQFLLVGRDETDNILIREQNEKLEKIATIGRAASTIFHEMNQPMSVIQISASLISDVSEGLHTENEDTLEIQKNIEIIIDQINRINQIVRNLRLFHSGNNTELQTVAFSPSTVIAKTIKDLKSDLDRNNIDVEITSKNTDFTIEENPVLFSQVIVNIVQNSIHALASTDRNHKRKILIHSETTEQIFIVTITDNGNGVEKHILDKVLEPFFTTKAAGTGSGLGLALCQDIVSKMNGTFELKNAQPQGLKVTISLPR